MKNKILYVCTDYEPDISLRCNACGDEDWILDLEKEIEFEKLTVLMNKFALKHELCLQKE